MKIKFDANQDYQLDAINAVLDVFEGQPSAHGEFDLDLQAAPGELITEAGIGNRLLLDEATILKNVRAVQERNGLPYSEPEGMNFSVEMETGTGKTYVFLRTIFEMNARYGWKKFIIIVPSVAIREGVSKTVELTGGHFAALFNNVPLDPWVYDSKQVSRLRGFATSNAMQLIIMNVDAFNKDTTIIQQERESGIRPIEFIQGVRPVVILDEAHNFTTENRIQAIERLNPLFTVRYSATLSKQKGVTPTLLYQLNPVQAYDLRLVKRIEVDSVLEQADFNKPYVALKSIKATKKDVTARLEIDVRSASGSPVRKEITARYGSDLYDLSGGRELYRGYVVSQIDASNQTVSFDSGLTLEVGEIHSARDASLMRVQIEETVREHFEKELRIQKEPEGQRLKVLSLFFIDRVANYVEDDGPIRRWFVDAYQKLAAMPRYAPLVPLPVDQVHGGYFSQEKKKVGGQVEAIAVDTSGKTLKDNDTYQLIMRDKERLLSRDTPLKFLFSHSALREGWDNPNVFQICTLNESKSETRKRQEIGRGLRLPVRENGERCFDPNINRLTVIANENYDDFARALQTEIESETGVTFEGRIANKRDRRQAILKKGWQLNPDFLELWGRIKHKTRYQVQFDTSVLIDQAAGLLREMPAIQTPQIAVMKGELMTSKTGLEMEMRASKLIAEDYTPQLPDLLGYLQRETELTRGTLAQILIQAGRLSEARKNPQQFLDQARDAIRKAMNDLIVRGIQYEKIDGDEYEMRAFEESDVEAYADRVLAVDRSIYDLIEYDSPVEKAFAEALDGRDDIRLFIKLPRWFTVDTPLGTYNPDWAIVKENDAMLYLVRETKGKVTWLDLRESERQKIRCGEAHFKAMDVDYQWVSNAAEV